MEAPALVDRVRSTPPSELAEIAVHTSPPLRATFQAYHRLRCYDPIWYHVRYLTRVPPNVPADDLSPAPRFALRID